MGDKWKLGWDKQEFTPEKVCEKKNEAESGEAGKECGGKGEDCGGDDGMKK